MKGKEGKKIKKCATLYLDASDDTWGEREERSQARKQAAQGPRALIASQDLSVRKRRMTAVKQTTVPACS